MSVVGKATMKRTIISLVASFILLLTGLTVALPAFANGGAIEQGHLSIDIEIIQAQKTMNQGDTYALAWKFTLSTTQSGVALREGDAIEVSSNIGELFEVDGGYGSLPAFELVQKNADGSSVTLATATVHEDKVVFTVAAGAEGMVSMSGQLITTNSFTAKDLGATEDNSVTRDLVIGNASTSIVFAEKAPTPPGSTSLSLVDIDTFWKNMWNRGNDLTVGVASMEVNPIGSLDLYGSTTRDVGEVASYQNLFLKDEIPEHGFVDLTSMQIYAAVPVLAVNNGPDYVDKWHGNYSIPHGTYFAQRSGTQRYSILDRMTQLEQGEGETLEQFEHRVRSQQLSWGVYTADDNTQTFMCNFGNVGAAANSNGITYEGLGGLGAQYAHDYPEIFSASGASNGNVVSYYVEFDTYYPEIVGLKDPVYNAAELAQAPNADVTPSRVGGNTAQYKINNGGGVGVARTNELLVKLVDEQTGEPLAGASFKVQQQRSDGSWEDTGISGTTDANGMLTTGDPADADHMISVGPFVNGTYRVVQTAWLHGYEEASQFGESGSDKTNNLDDEGMFTVTGSERYGFGTVVTNRRKTGTITLTPQSMIAYTGGNSLSESSFPAVRYAVAGAPIDAAEDIEFDIDGVKAYAHNVGNYWVLPELENTFSQDGAAVASDMVAGEYTIGVNAEHITAEGADGTRYSVTIDATASAQLTVRTVSQPEGVLAGDVDVVQPVVSDADDVDTSDGIGVAVIADATEYYTNGDESLGVVGDDEHPETPLIGLLFDELLPGEEGEDTAQMLRDRAGEEGHTLTEDNSELKYLDLVNERDGNAWMSTDDGAKIEVYWPIPEDLDPADYTFEILHFRNLHREYRGDMDKQIAESPVEVVSCRVEGENVVFTLEGDKDEGCFSPFALVWHKKAAPGPEGGSNTNNNTGDNNPTGNNSSEVVSQDKQGALPTTGDSTLPVVTLLALAGAGVVAFGVKRTRVNV